MGKNKKKKRIRAPNKSRRRIVAPPQPNRGGRPSLMTEEVRDRLCSALADGNHFDTACSYAGVGYSTFRGWLVEAQKPNPDPRLLEFLEVITRAMHEAEFYAVKSVKDQMTKDWRAAIAFLERRFPQKWGRRERVEHGGQGGGPIPRLIMHEARALYADKAVRDELDKIAKEQEEAGPPLLEEGTG